MRPTNTAIQNVAPAQQADVPQVGRQVTAAPVQFAVDDSAFKKLDILQNQLAAFNNGQMASAKLDDQLQQQRDTQQATMDFARNPNADAHVGSGYYYQAMMGLHADQAALDVESQIHAEHARLMNSPDELLHTNVAEHMKQFSENLYSGLNDPIVAGKVLKTAQAAAGSAAMSLSDAKTKLVKEDTVNSAWGVALQTTQNANGPEDLAARLNSFVAEHSALLGKEKTLELVAHAVSNAVAGATSGAAAEGYLKSLNVKGPDGSSLAERVAGHNPQLAEAVTKLQTTVGNMKAADTARALQAEKDAITAHNAKVKEQQDINAAKFDALVADGSVQALAQAKALADSGGLSTATAIRAQTAFNKAMLKAKDLDVAMNAKARGDVLLGPHAEVLREAEVKNLQARISADPSTAGPAYRAAFDTLSMSAPGQLPELNKTMFTGASALIAAYKPGQPMNPQLSAQLKAFGALNDNEVQAAGIPKDDYEALKMATSNTAAFGGDFASAIQVTQTSLASGGGTVNASDAAQAAMAAAKDLKDWAFHSDFSDSMKGWLESRGKVIAGSLDAARYPTAADVTKTLKQQIGGELIHVGGYDVGTSLRNMGNAGAVFLGNGLDKAHSRNYVEMGANALIEQLRADGHDVTIVPQDFKGSHQIVWKTAGNLTFDPLRSSGEFFPRHNQSEQRTPLSLTELEDLGKKIELARLKSAQNSHIDPAAYTHDLAVQVGELSKAHASITPQNQFITTDTAGGRLIGADFNKPSPGTSNTSALTIPRQPALTKLTQINASTTQAVLNKEKNSLKRQ